MKMMRTNKVYEILYDTLENKKLIRHQIYVEAASVRDAVTRFYKDYDGDARPIHLDAHKAYTGTE